MLLQICESWKSTYPGAVLGILAMQGVNNPPEHSGLEAEKTALEASLRRDYGALTRAQMEQLPAIQPYVAYYKNFNKSYHVLFQLESVALKGKSLPRVAALVEAMFMAELKNQLLTAGHDLDSIAQPLTLDIADGSQSYTLLNGQEQAIKARDMYLRDQQGVISSIIHGPDRRTPISAQTRTVLFTVYAPQGIGPARVEAHLNDIRKNVCLLPAAASVTALEIHCAE